MTHLECVFERAALSSCAVLGCIAPVSREMILNDICERRAWPVEERLS